MKNCVGVFLLCFISIAVAQAQNSAPEEAPAVPVKLVVTVESQPGAGAIPLRLEDVSILNGKESEAPTEWVSLQDDAAAMELYVVLDERVDPAATVQLDQLRRFISSQPPATAVGVAYLANGSIKIVQPPTPDHRLAAKALRPPSGDDSVAANPFTSLSSLIYGWSTKAPRREVVFVTDGVDVFEDVGGASMYLDIAIADAQRAGVLVYCLFAPVAGHAGHSPALINGGQAFLARLAEKTGGEAYFRAGEASSSFEPYLADVATHLDHQYRVSFLATSDSSPTAPVEGPGFRRVAFRSLIPGVEIISARGFYVKGAAPKP